MLSSGSCLSSNARIMVKKNVFPGIVFANTNMPEKRYRVCKSETELSELPADSTEVFKCNNLDRYIERTKTEVLRADDIVC